MKDRGKRVGPARLRGNGSARQKIAPARQIAAVLADASHDPAPGIAVTTFTRDYKKGCHIAAHAHGADQLIYARTGIMHVQVANRRWILPPQFGLWIPAQVVHEIRMSEPVSLRTLYLRTGLVALGDACIVLHVAPLLRELIFETVRLGKLRVEEPTECALRDLLAAQLVRASPVPTDIRLPLEKRALAIAQAILDDPAARAAPSELCRAHGLGLRTFERIFRKEVGLAFEAWRRQVRLTRAIELLIAGRSVKEAAAAVGYNEPSAFIALFRATLGVTPKAWVASLQMGSDEAQR